MTEQQRNELFYLQFDSFLPMPEIIHGIFTRRGGYSKHPFRGLNASYTGGDDLDHVLHNRLLVLQSLEIQTYPCATVWQVHGADVATLDTETWDDWRTDWPYRSYFLEEQELIWTAKPRRKADAIITRQRGVALALTFADCVPILLYNPAQAVIGIVHAGWRGTARGIALATVEAMCAQFACKPSDIYAGIGPSIGPECYEVGEHVQALFYGKEHFTTMPTQQRYCNLISDAAVFFMQQLPDRACPTVHLDMWETNRNQLLMAGLLPDHIELSGICTSCNMERFFSHRGEHGKTGRFPVVLALRNADEI